jgi:hypothetical protein
MTDYDDFIRAENHELTLSRKNSDARVEANRQKILLGQMATSESESIPNRIHSLTDGRKVRGEAFYWVNAATITLGKTSLEIRKFQDYPKCCSEARISDGNPTGSRRTFHFSPTLASDRIVWSMSCSHIDRHGLFSTAKVSRLLVEQLISVYQASRPGSRF